MSEVICEACQDCGIDQNRKPHGKYWCPRCHDSYGNRIKFAKDLTAPDAPILVDLDMAGDLEATKPLSDQQKAYAKKVRDEQMEAVSLYESKTPLFVPAKVGEVGKDCAGFVVEFPLALPNGRELIVDAEEVQRVFAKKFPGKPVVIVIGGKVTPLYATDEAFERAVESALAKIINRPSLTYDTNLSMWEKALDLGDCKECGKKIGLEDRVVRHDRWYVHEACVRNKK